MLCLTDTSFYIYMCVKHFGMANITFLFNVIKLYSIVKGSWFGPTVVCCELPYLVNETFHCIGHKVTERDPQAQLCYQNWLSDYLLLHTESYLSHVTHSIIGRLSICKKVTMLVTSFTWSTKLKRKVQDSVIQNVMFCWSCILVRLWVNDQLDEQLCYIIRLLLQSSKCFEQLCAHHQEVKLY